MNRRTIGPASSSSPDGSGLPPGVDGHRAVLREAGRLLGEGADGLVAEACDLLRETAFTNRYTLHPRKLAALGRQEAEGFLAWLADPAFETAVASGAARAREGLGETAMARLGLLLHSCAGRRLAPGAVRDAAWEAVAAYNAARSEGYMRTRDGLVLEDQEQLRRALSAALESQSRELSIKNHAIATSINGILLTDLDGKVTYVNAAFLSLLGYGDPRDVLGTPIDRFWSGAEIERVLQVLPSAGGWHGELATLRRDGTSFDAEMASSLIRDGTGAGIGIMNSLVDVTERKRLRTQVQQAQKMDALGQLAGGIAHDFNNLLSAISGYLQLLLLETPHDSRTGQDLLQIKVAVDRGAGLTRQLRYFTRQTPGVRQPVPLNEIVRETNEILRRTFPPEIAVATDLAPDLPSIEADPNQMSQVLINLCVNAKDAIAERSVGDGEAPCGTLRIRTSEAALDRKLTTRFLDVQPGRYVLLEVEDDGTGIPPEILDRLFMPFTTTKSKKSGTGLGLAVVYGIVRSHGGYLDVQSALGTGSRFSIYLPCAGTPTASVDAAGGPPEGFARGSGTVLVVDDEAQIRDIIARALRLCGYRVVTAENGRQALSMFHDLGRELLLVVLDMVMPQMGGREFLRRIRAEDRRVRIIVVTGHTTDGSADLLLQEGADLLMEKPLDLGLLASNVGRLVAANDGKG